MCGTGGTIEGFYLNTSNSVQECEKEKSFMFWNTFITKYLEHNETFCATNALSSTFLSKMVSWWLKHGLRCYFSGLGGRKNSVLLLSKHRGNNSLNGLWNNKKWVHFSTSIIPAMKLTLVLIASLNVKLVAFEVWKMHEWLWRNKCIHNVSLFGAGFELEVSSHHSRMKMWRSSINS